MFNVSRLDVLYDEEGLVCGLVQRPIASAAVYPLRRPGGLAHQGGEVEGDHLHPPGQSPGLIRQIARISSRSGS